MLVCQLIVWCLLTTHSDVCVEIYATEISCQKELIRRFPKAICREIDKLRDFTLSQWNADVCGLSEHEWLGEG